MAIDRKQIKAGVKKVFLPALDAMGFKRSKDGLGGYRVQGEFVDVISLQLSRDVGSLYLHYFRNMLCDPFRDLLNAITIGERLGGMEYSDWVWKANDADELVGVLDEILNAVIDRALPYLSKLDSFEEYAKAVEYVSEGKRYPFAMVVIHIINHDYGKALSLCESIKARIVKDDDFDFKRNDKDIKLLGNLDALIDALNTGSAEALQKYWVSENMDLLKVKAL